MSARDRDYSRRDPSLPLSAVIARFDRIAEDLVPLSTQAAAALPESPVTWGRLAALLTDTSVSFEVMDVNLVWRWLIERARCEGEDAVLECVGLAVPMLAATAARIAHRVGGDRADAEAAVLAAFVDALTRMSLTKTHLWCALRWAAYRGGRRWEKQEARASIQVPPQDLATRPQPPEGDLDALLALAVAEGVIEMDRALLIAETRLTGYPLIAMAAQRGVPSKRLNYQRKRAEEKLARWLHARISEADSDRASIVETAALDSVTRKHPGGKPILRAPAILWPSGASTECAGSCSDSAHSTPPEVKRCA